MILKPQDVLIVLKLVALGKKGWSYKTLAGELFMSSSEVHSGIKRAAAAHLIDHYKKVPIKKSIEEFIIHGVKYAFPPDRGDPTRGMPTGYAAPPLVNHFQIGNEPPPVWSDPEGNVKGYEFSPLYKSVPKAATVDLKLYELLALVDAIRDGRAREKNLAVSEIIKRISSK
jgi:hypothetical protein